jgi:hypothetical protein
VSNKQDGEKDCEEHVLGRGAHERLRRVIGTCFLRLTRYRRSRTRNRPISSQQEDIPAPGGSQYSESGLSLGGPCGSRPSSTSTPGNTCRSTWPGGSGPGMFWTSFMICS